VSRRDLVLYGTKLLREKCLPVEEINDDIKKLVADMIETMDASRGIGLAAPQIGEKLSIFVLRDLLADGESLSDEVRVYINPKISSPSKQMVSETEGCLSIPGIREEVKRPLSILIEATDLDGNRFKEELSGFNARIRMHENDHLNGVLFIDRLDLRRRKKLDPILKKMEKENK
jgi:peptide deformylase